MKAIFGLLAALGLACGIAHGATTLRGHVSREVVFGAAVEFDNTMQSTGMSGMSVLIRGCYKTILMQTASPARAEMCMLIDRAAVVMDRQFRQQMLGAVGKKLPATTSLLTRSASSVRALNYRTTYFDGSARMMDDYFAGSDSLLFHDLLILDGKGNP